MSVTVLLARPYLLLDVLAVRTMFAHRVFACGFLAHPATQCMRSGAPAWTAVISLRPGTRRTPSTDPCWRLRASAHKTCR